MPERVRKPPVTMITGAGEGREEEGREERSERASEAKEMKKASRATVREEGAGALGERAAFASLSSPSMAVTQRVR